MEYGFRMDHEKQCWKNASNPRDTQEVWPLQLLLARINAPLTFGEEGIIDDEFAGENFVVTEAKCAETGGEPSQAFTGRMGIGRMRIGCANDFAEQDEGRIGQTVFLQEGVEGNIFAMMAKFAVFNVEWG